MAAVRTPGDGQDHPLPLDAQEVSRVRQWFDALWDSQPACLNAGDVRLAHRLYAYCGLSPGLLPLTDLTMQEGSPHPTGELLPKDEALDDQRALAMLPEVPLHRWEGALRVMYDVLHQGLIKHGTCAEDAKRLTGMLVIDVVGAFGGQFIYMPLGTAIRRALRDMQMFEAWRHSQVSVAQLAQRYRISTPAAYAIIARQRRLARQQGPDLFGFDPPSTDD